MEKTKYYLETNGFTEQETLYSEKLFKKLRKFFKSKGISTLTIEVLLSSKEPTIAFMIMTNGVLLEYKSLWLNDKELKELENKLNYKVYSKKMKENK